ncbi:MAG: pyridoxamine 5'-phosphate oxidase [Vulcanimicrobiaceae bacterium]
MNATGGRHPSGRAALHEGAVDPDPLVQLQRWLDDAYAAALIEPTAMCVSTAGEDGQPSSRIVLARGMTSRGPVFYTSYFSRKGRELARNPRVAAAFYWPELERQIRITGIAERLSDEDSDAYFATRPRGHQLSAWASEQSEAVASRDILDQRVEDYAARFEGERVPRPHSWGGFLIVAERVEFWQGRADRMHDRLEYAREGAAWRLRRLQP